ncbi:MAG: hypothetical protein AB1762_22310 [Gemmatimonadota bacterium]
MYFWRIDPLRDQLAATNLPARDALGYVIGTFSLYALFIELSAYTAPEQVTPWDGLTSLITIAIALIGPILAYRANGGPAGRDFTARFLALGWVLGIRFLAVVGTLLVAFYLLLGLAAGVFGSDPSQQFHSWLAPLQVVVFSLLYYWRLAIHMARVRLASTVESALA